MFCCCCFFLIMCFFGRTYLQCLSLKYNVSSLACIYRGERCSGGRDLRSPEQMPKVCCCCQWFGHLSDLDITTSLREWPLTSMSCCCCSTQPCVWLHLPVQVDWGAALQEESVHSGGRDLGHRRGDSQWHVLCPSGMSYCTFTSDHLGYMLIMVMMQVMHSHVCVRAVIHNVLMWDWGCAVRHLTNLILHKT